MDLLFAGIQLRDQENNNETRHRSYPLGAYTSALFLSLTVDFGHGFGSCSYREFSPKDSLLRLIGE